MDELPDPATIRSEPPPAGHHYEWRFAEGFEAVAPGLAKTCRWMENHKGCGASSVLRMRRGTKRPAWWHYCAQHTWGRVVHNGRVWEICVVRDREPAS